MYLTVASPTGAVSSIDLRELPSWRVELAELSMPGDEKPEVKHWIAVCLRYVAAGATVLQVVAALNVPQSTGELARVAITGLPKGQRVPDKERLRESLRILCNCPDLTGSAAEDIAAEGSKLADVYHDVLGALFSNQQAMPIPGPVVKGEYHGWRYSVSRERFAAVLDLPVIGGGGLGPPPALPGESAEPKEPKPDGDRPPPPTAGGKGSSRRQPPKP